MITFSTYKRVRYGETDQMGYLYYGNYASYYEIGRAETFRSLGLIYKDMEKELGVLMPVMYMQSRFLRPATYDELIEIKTIMKKIPTNEVTLITELFNEKGDLINQGIVKLCYIDAKTGKRVNAPASWNEKIAKYFD